MFFFPISDDNQSNSKPYVCYSIIAICCFIFLWQSTLPTDLNQNAIYNFGVIPAALLGDQPSFISPFLTVFTSMFMHGGWMHLIGNMVFLWMRLWIRPGKQHAFQQWLAPLWMQGCG